MDDVKRTPGGERIDKPWGHEIIWARTDRYVGKILFIRKGHMLSLQYHELKDETIFLQSGVMRFTVGEKDAGAPGVRTLRAGERYHIRPGVIHRMEALEDCHVFEVSTPELDDVVRLEDVYGRAPEGNDGAPSP